ncbi:hypothetical protein [Pseudoalteromonas ardens]|uniref:hypothetical protein n=1 Tax=Pseudoalteromonas ardens TaxID=3048490 RepID=UPI000AB42006|nr:hypothetical protein [Pseudoalteromonas sp. R96]MDK1309833.1 hypothetical protein [Pseudoalteromonas sp. R96]
MLNEQTQLNQYENTTNNDLLSIKYLTFMSWLNAMLPELAEFSWELAKKATAK